MPSVRGGEMNLEFDLPDEASTTDLGAALAALLDGRGTVFLDGELGAGKTTLSRGMLRAMGHTGAVKSPTFTLVEPYVIGSQKIYHFDLYRLEDPEELEYIGFDDFFEGERNVWYVTMPDFVNHQKIKSKNNNQEEKNVEHKNLISYVKTAISDLKKGVAAVYEEHKE